MIIHLAIGSGEHCLLAPDALTAGENKSGSGNLSFRWAKVALGANQVTGFLRSGKVPRRWGNGHPTVVPYQPFRTADTDVIVAVGNDQQYRRFCEVLGRIDLADDPRFTKMAGRIANRDALLPQISETMLTRPSQYWTDNLEANNVPCGRINNYQQVLRSPRSSTAACAST